MVDKSKKAFREIPVQLKISHSYNNEISLELERNGSDESEDFTDKQMVGVTNQIEKMIRDKLENTKFIVSKAIRCPNCGSNIDETSVPNKYHCDQCNCSVNMEFKK